jgi:hypothetical protein
MQCCLHRHNNNVRTDNYNYQHNSSTAVRCLRMAMEWSGVAAYAIRHMHWRMCLQQAWVARNVRWAKSNCQLWNDDHDDHNSTRQLV